MELNNKSAEVFRLHGFFASFRAQVSVEGKVYTFLRMFLIFFCLSGSQAVGIICVSGRNQYTKNLVLEKQFSSFPSSTFFSIFQSPINHLKKTTLNCSMNLYEL